ncbi:MAG: LysR family transcriptional regulator [Oligoflexia bacterium]|nr:LysR family transcriptional regulator [Oligoflexia bacterium]
MTRMRMGQWINYHHLYYFKKIAEEKSVSKAAAKLKLGQPTLSAQLKQFEENLGVQLFERKKNRLKLTPTGAIALEYAKSIFKLGEELSEALSDKEIPLKPHLHIGTIDDIPKNASLALAKTALSVSPCHIHLVEGKSDHLLRELLAYKIDILLTNFLPSSLKTKNIAHRLVRKDPVFIYASKEYKHLKKNFPHSLSYQPFILPTYDSKLRYDVEHWAKIHGIVLDIAIETQDIAVKKIMATNGLGLIPIASHSVKHSIQNGTLIEIGKIEETYEEIILLSVERKIENPFIIKVIQKFNI